MSRIHARLAALSAVIILAFGLSGCGINEIPRQDEAVKAAWSQVLNEYQRRNDLIPNLVNTVKGYAHQEQTVLTEVIQARAKATQTQINLRCPSRMNRKLRLCYPSISSAKRENVFHLTCGKRPSLL